VLDYKKAQEVLSLAFADLESNPRRGARLDIPAQLSAAVAVLFRSKTQAYREALLGCILARMADPPADVHLPYLEMGPQAFSGRTLDEKVVNPFLRTARIPSSRGPYLSVFRRSVRFDQATRQGLRDRDGYDAFLLCLEYLGQVSAEDARALLDAVLHAFYDLREAAHIPVVEVRRLSLSQWDGLLARLLERPSGGRMPVLIVAATLKTIDEFFRSGWEVEFQGINVADSASGAGGDITVRSGRDILLVAEVTERPVDEHRVVSTFDEKIAPAGVAEYIFFVKPGAPTTGARVAAERFFAQGHDVNFVEIGAWVVQTLATTGRHGRDLMNRHMVDLLDTDEVPASVKTAWNAEVLRSIRG
jgi:hypothetical protein